MSISHVCLIARLKVKAHLENGTVFLKLNFFNFEVFDLCVSNAGFTVLCNKST